MICGVLLDLSGVLYVGDSPLPGARAALERLQRAGMPLRYVTNTSRSPRASIVRQLHAMGFDIPEDAVFTAPRAARDYLVRHGLRPHLVVHPALEAEFADLVGRPANAVLVGDAGEAFSYERLNRAFRLLLEGAPLLAIARNRYFQEPQGLSLDAGPFVVALEYAAGTQATILGKPAAEFFHAAAAGLGCAPADVVMVGDDAHADVDGALAAGLQAVLVQTGKYRSGDEERMLTTGAVVLPDLAATVEWMLARR